MIRYVTKKRYWDLLDSGLMSGIQPTSKWHLKDIQDAVCYDYLRGKAGLDIAEIGAGHSRLLPEIAKYNRCYAIDEYKGHDGGPKSRPELPNVTFFDCKIGGSQHLIRDESFDILFSVSVVEHITSDSLEKFFFDCRRIMKKGGLMIHLIDVYVGSSDAENLPLWDRIQRYQMPFRKNLFEWKAENTFNSLEDIRFDTSFSTNPDNVMRDWNVSAPNLVEKRRVAQSCTLEMVGYAA